MSVSNYYANTHIFDSRANERIINIRAPNNKFLNASFHSLSINQHLQYVSELADLPAAVAGVITLVAAKTYILLGDIDLLGDRICGANSSALYGLNSETTSLTSTGLGMGVALITSIYTFNIQNLKIKDVDTAFDLQADDTINYVGDWIAIVLENIPTMGYIKDYSNFIVSDSAFLNCGGMTFDGTFGTIGFSGCLFTNETDNNTFTIASTATIVRRFKIIESSIVTIDATSIFFSASATAPPQSYVLTSVNFAGGVTHLAGVQSTDNKALFFKCLGISNSRSVGGMHMVTPAANTGLTQNVWVKVAGSTDPNSNNQKFSHSNNNLTYTGTLSEIFTTIFSCSITGTNNNIIEIGLGINGADPTNNSISTATLDSGGAISYMGSSTFEELRVNYFVELFVRNTSSTNDLTVVSMSLTTVGEF